MLQLVDIKKDYKTGGQSVHALKGVTLRFRKNEFVSILGASGCGKTTMLNIIGGLDHYTSGDLIINGKSTKKYKDKDWDVYRNHRIGFVFQSYNLIPHQTVLGNVEIALTIAGVSKAERKRRAAEALKRVGLEKELKKRPNQLSGGQMQRVAIARALVNNPEILLADEPTGALDTETSVQIMDLIREIAGDRLVIMVTHNPELAEEYSSRIVRLQDGLVLSDSNPYYGEETEPAVQTEETEPAVQTEETLTAAQPTFKETCVGAIEESLTQSALNGEKVTNEGVETAVLDALSGNGDKKRGKKNKSEKKKAPKAKKERSSMSFKTSLGLSARNLAMKKGRTIITSIAGSIGIISVCLVLALSNGFNGYIMRTQEDMLASNPIKISETTVDVEAIMNGMSSTSDLPDLDKLGDKAYVDSFITSMAKGMSITNNISAEYQAYVDDMDEDIYEAICKSTGVELSDYIYTEAKLGEDDATTPISLTTLQNTFIGMSGLQPMELKSLYSFIALMGSPYGTIPGTTKAQKDKGNYGEYARSQYDVIEGSYPTSANEAVLVVGENNQISDLVAAQLGLLTRMQFQSLIDSLDKDAPEATPLTVDFNQIVGKKYVLSNHDSVYTSGTDFLYDYQGVRGQLEITDGSTVTVTGILRLKEGMNYGCLGTGGLYFTEQAVDEFVATNTASKMSAALNAALEFALLETDAARADYVRDAKNAEKLPYLKKQINGDLSSKTQSLMSADTTPLYNSIAVDGETYYVINAGKAATLMQVMGCSEKVTEISIYASNFDSKKQILNYLDEWNDNCADPANEVKYTDTIGMLMEMVEMMLNAITVVLVAFTAISLIVSSVMIGIITYVSVVERVKEIGVLRSLGARKKDIKNLFNAETFIIGLASGLLGVGVTYLLSIGINALLGNLTGISTLASLPIMAAAIMVTISVVLTLISGLIPAKAAAKKDPVVALRSE